MEKEATGYRIVTIGLLICLIALGACKPTENSPELLSPMPSITHTLQPASTPTDVSEPSSQSTATFLPALSGAEAESQILELLADNGGCRFPCFLNLHPGQIDIATVSSVFHEYSRITPTGNFFGDSDSSLYSVIEIIIPRDDVQLEIGIQYAGDRLRNSDILKYQIIDFRAYDSAEYEPANGNTYYAQYFAYYTLPSILSTYGQPENVYIRFENEPGIYVYFVILDYSSSGWVALFTMPLYPSGDFVIGCPNYAFTTLWLWSPEDQLTRLEFHFGTLSGPLESIEEANSMTVEDFYQIYKDPANTQCLETPADAFTP